MGKENAVNTYSGLLLGHEKGKTVMCCNMDEPVGHHASWNNPVTGQPLHDSAYICLTLSQQKTEWEFAWAAAAV